MVVIRVDGQLYEIILVTYTMNINSVKTRNEVRPGNKWHHKESKQPVSNQNGKAGDFPSVNTFKIKAVLRCCKGKGEK
jgi:hypothetical protein